MSLGLREEGRGGGRAGGENTDSLVEESRKPVSSRQHSMRFASLQRGAFSFASATKVNATGLQVQHSGVARIFLLAT